MFEVGYTTDRICELSNLINDFPDLLKHFTDSDCENGTNAYARTDIEMYYLCDFHLGQLVKSGLTYENTP